MASKIDFIHYGRDSGPVPPMYYSRDELIAQPGQITVKRWDGDEQGEVNVTMDRSFPLSSEQFQQIVDALPGFAIKNVTYQPCEDGTLPVGGPNEWLILKAGEELLAKGGDELEGDVGGLVQLLKSFIPEEGKPRSPLMD